MRRREREERDGPGSLFKALDEVTRARDKVDQDELVRDASSCEARCRKLEARRAPVEAGLGRAMEVSNIEDSRRDPGDAAPCVHRPG